MGKTHHALSFEERVKKAIPNLSEPAVTQIVELLSLALQKVGVNNPDIEAVEFSKVRETITLFTRGEEIEVGLKENFGAPRRREREFIQQRGGHFAVQCNEQEGLKVFGGCTRVHPLKVH